MADVGLVTRARRDVASYVAISRLWVRASLEYPVSFWTMTVGGVFSTGIDFIGIWVMFTHLTTYGGFTLREMGFLYGSSQLGIGIADLVVGNVERIGQQVRMGRLDAMMTKPVPLLVQVCSDQFQLRRISRVVQGAAVLTWASWTVDWTPTKVLVLVGMVVCGGVIFFGAFVAFSCVQFWTTDASEFANAFTYGGATLLTYPLTVFPQRIVLGLTFLLPLAFVNWYPSLYILGRSSSSTLPQWLEFASPVAALVMVAVTMTAWRAGVRHYTSTGS
ncbi:MAG: ABC transporter permease [Nocardioides sp.]